MANTYNLIGSATVGSGGSASIDFTSIPTTYTDLLIKGSFRLDVADGSFARKSVLLKINGALTNMSSKGLYSLGSSGTGTFSTTTISAWGDSNLATASTFSNYELYIPNYQSSNYKSTSMDSALENNSSNDYGLLLLASLWSNTAAITSLSLIPDTTGNFVQYTTAYLYGIKNS
jgi:hypothetical protein